MEEFGGLLLAEEIAGVAERGRFLANDVEPKKKLAQDIFRSG
jgi:hypothetical protein